MSELFFSFHLLDMVNKSNDLRAVFKAVTQNGYSILMTALFGVVTVYIYAIVHAPAFTPPPSQASMCLS